MINHHKCLYLGFYLADGSLTAWYTSVEKNRPHIMQDFAAFLSAFKEHFEDSDRYATALTKLQKLKQAPGSAAADDAPQPPLGPAPLVCAAFPRRAL